MGKFTLGILLGFAACLAVLFSNQAVLGVVSKKLRPSWFNLEN